MLCGVVIMHARTQSISLAMRKSIHGFPFLSYKSLVLRLAALQAIGAPL